MVDTRELINTYNIPYNCKQCDGVMVFKGVGEYQCEACGALDWDDYGKVRNYIEKHKGATAAEIEAAVGVPQRSIRRMLKESRIEIAEGSKVFLYCESCGKKMRSGRFCSECEVQIHRSIEAQHREALRGDMRGYGHVEAGESGHRRFMREEI